MIAVVLPQKLISNLNIACCLDEANKMMLVQPSFFFCHKWTSFPANFAVCSRANRAIDASTPRNVVSFGAIVIGGTSMVTACMGHITCDEMKHSWSQTETYHPP